MGATNHTTNYELPQWIGTDKPTFLGDMNDAFLKIDTQMKTNADSATNAESLAGNAESSATSALQNASQALQAAQTAGSNANQALDAANNAANTANSAQSVANAASVITTPLSSNGGWISSVVDVNSAYFSTNASMNIYGQTFDGRLYVMYNDTLNLIMLRGQVSVNKGASASGGFVRLCTLPSNFPSTISQRNIATFCPSRLVNNINQHFIYYRSGYITGRDIYVSIDSDAVDPNNSCLYLFQEIYNTVGWYK